MTNKSVCADTRTPSYYCACTQQIQILLIVMLFVLWES